MTEPITDNTDQPGESAPFDAALTEPGLPEPGVEPRIIPESEHPIREQQLDREALKTLYRLRDAGFKGYLVGGGVRDLFLGRTPKDFDISTDARPGQLRKLFRNSRTIGRRFRLVQVFFKGGKILEVSTLRSRSEFEDQDEVLAANNSFGTLEEDAFRRDLTINALFYEVENHTVIDYVGGVEDLNRGVIRMVGDPDLRFRHDPVRMLRAVRHASRTGFVIDPATLEAIGRHAGELKLCPTSRLRDEVLKDLHSGKSLAWAERCMDTPLWHTLFPFYKDCGPEAATRLLRILGEIDRVYQSATEDKPVAIGEHFLFACLLLPWACERFGLPGERLQGPPFNRRWEELALTIEEQFGAPFNVTRMARDRITGLFMHLATLRQASEEGEGGKKGHPRWLKRKSYYRECKHLYDLYRLAQGEGAEGIRAEDFARKEPAPGEVSVITDAQDAPPPPSHAHGRGTGGPAFSSHEGGVFGLKSGGRRS